MRSLAAQDRVVRKGQREEKPMGEWGDRDRDTVLKKYQGIRRTGLQQRVDSRRWEAI